MRYFVLDPQAPARQEEADEITLSILQSAVGGDIEAVPYPPDPKIALYYAAEGKFTGATPNDRASAALREARSIFPTDFVAGTLVVTGFDPDSGDDVDLAALPPILARWCS